MKYLYFLTFGFALFLSCNHTTNGILVSDVDAFNTAVANATPGDKIVLKNGIWQDAELLFEAYGTADNPITLTVETKGKVFLEGGSHLNIAGEHLIVEGLIFRNGYTPTNEVISFKKDSKTLAYNTRLTECVIDNYSNPERHEQDSWVALYGKNNRVDHCHFEGKSNRGVTLIVRLNTEESRENNHRIDHNYFGPRPNLGSNGGETLRIGTSHFSLTNSNTLVESNYFDRCNGEHEIISNKSCQNTYRYNTFFECIGTLTMRHGNETLVDGNAFIGNGKASTGGIRVINGQQTVVNNYGYGLTGYRFRGALVLMNGVPNSPLNRYFQVEDAVVDNNAFVDCDHVQLCAGADAERSAAPINSSITNNVFYHQKKGTVFTVYDDVSGIDFNQNWTGSKANHKLGAGVYSAAVPLKKDKNGFLVPVKMPSGEAFTLSDKLAIKENTGAPWYSKEDKGIPLNSGKIIRIDAGQNTLFDAAKTAAPGDIVELAESGNYSTNKIIEVSKALTFRAAKGVSPKVFFEKKSLFDIQNGGSLMLEGITFDGEDAPDGSGNSVVRTSKYSMNKNYKLFIDNCNFVNLDVNHSFDVVRVFKNTFADTLQITNSTFKDVTGHVAALDKEIDDTGIYNAEYVILKNNSFTNIGKTALTLYRGGSDESTFGPFLELENCRFENIGHDKRNTTGASVLLHGVQSIEATNSSFAASKPIKTHLVVGEPVVLFDNLNLYKTPPIQVTGDQPYNIGKITSKRL